MATFNRKVIEPELHIKRERFLKFRFRLKNTKNLIKKFKKMIKNRQKYQEKITENNHKLPKNSSKNHQKKLAKKCQIKNSWKNCQKLSKMFRIKFVQKLNKKRKVHSKNSL